MKALHFFTTARSVSAILAQGRMLAFLLAALVALLGRSTVSLLLRCRQADSEAGDAHNTAGDSTQPGATASSTTAAGAQMPGHAAAAQQPLTAAKHGSRQNRHAREGVVLLLLLLAANLGLASHGLVRAFHTYSGCRQSFHTDNCCLRKCLTS